MGAPVRLIIPLEEISGEADGVGGKASHLAALMRAGYRVPAGFCVTTRAYEEFAAAGNLTRIVKMELGRKSLAAMRWEEIWDAALRIRTAFLRAPIPEEIIAAVRQAAGAQVAQPLVVRSSALGEDSGERSFAGLHESVVGVEGEAALLDALRVVWASLWSDAALLYRRELELDPTRSAMAVVVQGLLSRAVSGVAFGCDPRDPARDQQIIEAVPGLCRDLVDGAVDPDRWVIARSSGRLLEHRPGLRPTVPAKEPLLSDDDLAHLHRTLVDLSALFGWDPDIEWTGRGADFTLLQARPVTTADPAREGDPREWYLSLRPGRARLDALCKRVTEELIPQLEGLGHQLAAEALDELPDAGLADALMARADAYAHWKEIYRDEFIPFAHGVRQLGSYYSDAVKPRDPYEFVGLLRDQAMIAFQRNAALGELAASIAAEPQLRDLIAAHTVTDPWPVLSARLAEAPGGGAFLRSFEATLAEHLDVAYGGERLSARPDLVLHLLLEWIARPTKAPASKAPAMRELERKLYDAVGPARRDEAAAVLRVARLSWKLRDDDNILLGRLEDQVLRAGSLAIERLRHAGRLVGAAHASTDNAPLLSAALRDPEGSAVELPAPKAVAPATSARASGETPRQLVGQPAAPGLATALARIVHGPEDLQAFRAGEILICDAIQPTMSHVVPLAAGFVERRGGMLIHGAIIAREMGIPCVNGVDQVVLSIENGEIVTVDGHLGIVTVGPPEFDLEVDLAG